ncbi:MAG: hypothetical protein AB8B52_06940 [Winogradskyella sp.]|uniref:hypothetical protein n=1 Tax=Winogradskyella sp. TaxID=1883156 RepID=UPI0038581183
MKNLMNFGKALNKAEQKQVFGGFGPNRLTKADGGACYSQVYLEECPDEPGFPDRSNDDGSNSGCWALEYIC